MATFGSQRSYYTQATNSWILWMGIGIYISFFAFTELGQQIVKEGAKAAKGKIPPGEEWKLPWKWRPGERKPPSLEIPRVQQPEQMRESEVLYEALPKIAQKLVECLPEDVKMKFVAYYDSDPDYVLKALNGCMGRMDVGIIPGTLPTKFGEVGWIGKVSPNPADSEIRLIGYGSPTTRKELLITLKGVADWIKAPQYPPLYKTVR